MKRMWSIIDVNDVPAGFRWYQSLLILEFSLRDPDGYHFTISWLDAD